jgi:preprotein translocase subunit SecA
VQTTSTEQFLKIQVTAEPPRRQPPPPPPVAATKGADDLFNTPAAKRGAAALPPPSAGNGSPLKGTPLGGSHVPEVGRNDPCPCGSGKKYKKCHGAGR